MDKMKMELTIGKIRGLQRCSAPNGTFTILALDHRGNLKRAFNPQSPDTVSYQQIVEFKRALTTALSPCADGILLDPVYGAAQTIASGAVHGSTGILVAVEKTGYAGDASERVTQILPGWGVDKIARMGAAAVKLLVYYHPEAPNAADQEAIVAWVAEQCQQNDVPLFLEPLSYSLDPLHPKLASAQKRWVVIETARRLTPMGVDVLKAEFPVNIGEEPDEKVWAEACGELSAASVVPWVLLSAGVSYEDFLRQTRIACQQGASGVLAGRAVWKEAVQLSAEALDAFLHTTATKRLTQLAEVVRVYAKPWTNFYPHLEATVGEGWYQQYGTPEKNKPEE
jgi:tagatose 1,6-diphosphate aldolase